MAENKNKKRTLSISTSIKKKIDLDSINKSGKKSFSIEKKQPFRASKDHTKSGKNFNQVNRDPAKKNFARKFIEQ